MELELSVKDHGLSIDKITEIFPDIKIFIERGSEQFDDYVSGSYIIINNKRSIILIRYEKGFGMVMNNTKNPLSPSTRLYISCTAFYGFIAMFLFLHKEDEYLIATINEMIDYQQIQQEVTVIVKE